MNETENKKSGGMSIPVMIGLILVLILGVKFTFWGVEAVLPEPPADPYEVLDADTGEKSPWTLYIGPVERNAPDQEWIEKCEGGQGFHGFIDSAPNRWAAAVYLPGVEEKLQNTNASVKVETTEEGDNVLVVYVSTVGAEQGADPLEQILWLTAPEGESWPTRLSVVLNGAELEQESLCMRTGGQMFWTN